MSVQISVLVENGLLLHVVKGELGVVHGILRSVDVVVRVLERALDTVRQHDASERARDLRKGRLVAGFTETSVVGTSVSTLSLYSGNVNCSVNS
jgi:hypothetical protein